MTVHKNNNVESVENSIFHSRKTVKELKYICKEVKDKTKQSIANTIATRLSCDDAGYEEKHYRTP
jgi:hypothetical protein